MDSRADCYVAGTLVEILRISRLGGLAPLKFVKRGSGWRLGLSTSWSYYGYILVMIIIVTTLASVIIDLLLMPEQSVRMATTTRRVVWIIDVACMLLITGTIAFSAPGQMRAMFGYLNRIGKINFELNISYWPMYDEKKKRHFFFFWMFSIIVLTVADYGLLVAYTATNQGPKWIVALASTYYICYWILQLRETTLVMITLHVMYCFRSVNDGLKNLLGSNQKRGHESVRRLALAFADTCDVVRDVDRAHGPILLMMLGSFLLHLVCTPYYVITSILFQNIYTPGFDRTKHMAYMVVQLLWCAYHAVNLVAVIEPCHLTLMEMKTTSKLVSDLLHCTDSAHNSLAMELDMFLKHLFVNKASYSAMQMATVSRPLLATILGSVTTYLVIVIEL